MNSIPIRNNGSKPILDSKGNHIGWVSTDAYGQKWEHYPSYLQNTRTNSVGKLGSGRR
jgi:hypothetical protein